MDGVGRAAPLSEGVGAPRQAPPVSRPPGVPLRQPVHPGRFLERHFLEPFGLSQTEAARRLGISRRRVNEIVMGHRGLSADTAIRLALALGWPASEWLALQANWDSHHTWKLLNGLKGGGWKSPLPPPPVDLRVRRVLERVLGSLSRADTAEHAETLRLEGLDAVDRASLAFWLPPGELEVWVEAAPRMRARNTSFAGVWWVSHDPAQATADEWLEVGRVPRALQDAAGGEGLQLSRKAAAGRSEGVESIRAELAQRQRRWRSDQPARVLNLSMWSLDATQRAELDGLLGQGRVRMLAHGSSTCETCSTRLSRVWRVRRFDARGQCLLDVLEIGPIPDHARPSESDLEEASATLGELVAWMQQA